MIERQVLDEIAIRAAFDIFPRYENRPATEDLRQSFEREIIDAIRRETEQPFVAKIDVGRTGSWSLSTRPLMTEADKRRERERIAAAEAEARKAKIESDKLRARLYSSRASVHRDGDGTSIDIDGMIEDLRHWNLPPDLFNEGGYGFQRALEDVRGYLLARKRRG